MRGRTAYLCATNGGLGDESQALLEVVRQGRRRADLTDGLSRTRSQQAAEPRGKLGSHTAIAMASVGLDKMRGIRDVPDGKGRDGGSEAIPDRLSHHVAEMVWMVCREFAEGV